eukprot:2482337-Prymnesium_polylepis.1
MPLALLALAVALVTPLCRRAVHAPRVGVQHVVARAKAPVAPAVALPEGSAVELWHAGRLNVGNYRGRVEGSSALRVELADGETIKVDAGQLIDLWESDGPMRLPNSTAEWEKLQTDAASLLADLPPHMLDLRPLWIQLNNQKGGGKRITSDMVASSLFS